jgi:hypothetical protein
MLLRRPTSAFRMFRIDHLYLQRYRNKYLFSVILIMLGIALNFMPKDEWCDIMIYVHLLEFYFYRL